MNSILNKPIEVENLESEDLTTITFHKHFTLPEVMVFFQGCLLVFAFLICVTTFVINFDNASSQGTKLLYAAVVLIFLLLLGVKLINYGQQLVTLKIDKAADTLEMSLARILRRNRIEKWYRFSDTQVECWSVRENFFNTFSLVGNSHPDRFHLVIKNKKKKRKYLVHVSREEAVKVLKLLAKNGVVVGNGGR